MKRLVAAIAVCLAFSPARGAGPAGESARYRVLGAEPWRSVRAVEGAGYRVALSSPDGVALEASVQVSGGALRDDAPFPLSPATVLPVEAQQALRTAVEADADADALSRLLLRGARTELEAVERVIGYVARRIRYDLPGRSPETAASCRRTGRGSCVGRSLLAADLLLRAGIPARQVTGILVASSPSELTPETRQVFSEEISGVRHRWIETFVPGLGWVPSDPGGLANTVTARHLALPGAPPRDFGLRVLARSPERTLPRLVTQGGLAARGRPRQAPEIPRVELAPFGEPPR